MSRLRRYAFLLSAATLWLCGCASIGELTSSSDPLVARIAECLDRDDWQVDPAWSADGGSDSFRWRLGREAALIGDGSSGLGTVARLLDEWGDSHASAAGGKHPLLTLARRRDRIGRNAAILLARSDHAEASAVADRVASLVVGEPFDSDEGTIESLIKSRTDVSTTSADDRPSLASRAAAAEAWCRLSASGDGSTDEKLAAPGRAWSRGDLPDLVRGQLLRSLSRHLPPERIIGFGRRR